MAYTWHASEEISAFSGGVGFSLSCDNGSCELPKLSDPWVQNALERVGVFIFLAFLVMLLLCVESCASWCAERNDTKYSNKSDKKDIDNPRLLNDDDVDMDDHDDYNTEYAGYSQGLTQRERHGCCCPCTWRRPWNAPRETYTRWFAIGLALCSLGLLYVGYIAVEEVGALDKSLKALASDLDVVDTWFNDLATETTNVSVHVNSTRRALNTAFTTTFAGSPLNSTEQNFQNVLNEAVNAVESVARQTNSLTDEMNGHIQSTANYLKRYIDEYNGYWRDAMLGVVIAVGVLIFVNAVGLIFHGMSSSCKHDRGYHAWRFCFAPTMMLMIFLLFILTTVYFIVTVAVADVCIDPSDVALTVASNIRVGNHTYADNEVNIQIAIPLPDQSLANLNLPAGIEFLKACDGKDQNYGPCYYADNKFTNGQLIEFYLDCGGQCMLNPFRKTEEFLETIVFESSSTIIHALAEGADAAGQSSWLQVTEEFDDMISAVTGGTITQTGSQPYGLLKQISCEEINSRIAVLLEELCDTSFPQIERIYIYTTGIAILIVLVELFTRALMWESDPVKPTVRIRNDPFERDRDGKAVRLNPTFDPNFDPDAPRQLEFNRGSTGKPYRPPRGAVNPHYNTANAANSNDGNYDTLA